MPTIMIVDDSPTILEIFQYFLTSNGYTALPVANGETALALITNGNRPDLILLDVVMPGMDGLDVCRQLKACEATREIPVIFISESVDTLRGFAVGGVDYVPKSADYQEILARVNAHLTIQRQQQQLRAQQEQMIVQAKLASLGELTAGISHELKNPLNFICNFSQAVLDLTQNLREELTKPQPDPQELHYLIETLPDLAQKIHNHGERAARIIHNMLQHARGEPGVRTPTNLNRLVHEYTMMAYHSQKTTDFHPTITTRYDPVLDTQLVSVIAHDVSRVIVNLCTNALYALRERMHAQTNGFRPTLTVQTYNQADTVHILIHDNGVGIPEAIREKIFQPFFTTKPPGEGTGLGLSLAHDIVVHEHHGQLLVNSQPDEYTEFTVILPKENFS